MDRNVGLVLLGIGIVVALVGLLALTGALSWFGRLPGDIRIENENTRVYIPLASMVVVSVVLSVVAAVVRRLF